MTALAATPAAQVQIAGPKARIPLVQEYTKDLPVGDAGWSIHIVNPQQWRNPTRQGGQDHSPYAYSDLKNRVTYLRDDAFMLSPDVIRRVMAHEMGHLTLNTSDEGKANKWADSWLRSHSSR